MRLLPVVLALFVPGVLAAQVVSTYSGPQLVVTGTGEVEFAADRASVTVGVEARGSSGLLAGGEAARRIRAIVDTVRGLGISGDGAVTSTIEIHPEYANNTDGKPPKIAGYVARGSIRILIRAIETTGAVLDAVLARQASSVSDIEFASSRQDEGRRQAIEAAVLRARDDAEAMARAAGGSVGALIELSSQPAVLMPIGIMRASLERAAPMQILPGMVHISASVSARWAFVGRR